MAAYGGTGAEVSHGVGEGAMDSLARKKKPAPVCAKTVVCECMCFQRCCASTSIWP